MWCVVDFEGSVVHSHVLWDEAVTWAMKHGGDFDIVFHAWAMGEGGV